MRWAELRMCRFWAGGISSFPFSRAREYRLLRRLYRYRPKFMVSDWYRIETKKAGIAHHYVELVPESTARSAVPGVSPGEGTNSSRLFTPGKTH